MGGRRGERSAMVEEDWEAGMPGLEDSGDSAVEPATCYVTGQDLFYTF